MILKMLDSAHQKTLWLCILPKKLRSEKEYNVIISLSICSETENSCFMQSIDHLIVLSIALLIVTRLRQTAVKLKGSETFYKTKTVVQKISDL